MATPDELFSAYVQAIAADIARELRDNPNAWLRSQSDIAKSASGRGCYFDSKTAVCWTLDGHIYKRIPKDVVDLYPHIERLFARFVRGNFVFWMDAPKRTVAHIIALCEKVVNAHPAR